MEDMLDDLISAWNLATYKWLMARKKEQEERTHKCRWTAEEEYDRAEQARIDDSYEA